MRVLISIASLAALAGCTYSLAGLPPGQPVRTVYEEAAAPGARPLRIETAPAPGAGDRTRPVIYPPKVFAVWVPEHLDRERDFKIGAHYVYMKLRDSSWLEEPIDREPLTAAPANPSDLAELKALAGSGRLGRMIVPFESRSPEVPPEGSRERRPENARGGRP
jgi:hypothetical protein